MGDNKKRRRYSKCLYCRKEIISSSYSRKYCNSDCQFNHRVELKLVRVGSDALKSYIIRTKGRKCEICQLEKWLDKPITLELHHIDGNSDNNDLNNLQIICPNCHSQTDNYKAKNKNSSRVTRLKIT